jgi:hypothetical protein
MTSSGVAGTPVASDVRFPVKLNNLYPCQGFDRDGEAVVFDDVLDVGDRVASVTDDDGNQYGPFGVVVRHLGQLWIELEPAS